MELGERLRAAAPSDAAVDDRRILRVSDDLAAVLCLIAAVPASASASFHLIKIREVGNANPADYVELQMYASGENFVAGHFIHTYDSAGAELSTSNSSQRVAEGGNQRTILVGRDTVAMAGHARLRRPRGVGADGAVCYLDTLRRPRSTASPAPFTSPGALPTGTPASRAPRRRWG